MVANLIIMLVIVSLVGIYIWLRRSVQHDKNLPANVQAGLPAVSEDANLPTEFLDPLKQGQETTPRTNVPPQQ